MKRLFVLILSLIFAFSIVGCAGKSSETNADQNKKASENSEPIKIGGVFSASGSAASLGKPEMDTLKMMADKVNAEGGINGRKIEVVAYDDKSDQNEAVIAIKKLIEQDKVVAVIGGTISGNSLAMIPQAEKAKIPFISVAASKNINKPVKKYVFKTAQGDDVVIPRVVEYLKSQNLTKVAWLSVDNPYGSSGKEEFVTLAKDAGIEIVSSEVFEATVNDAKPMLTRVKQKNPQAIVIWGTAQESAIVTKNVRELGIQVPIIESHGIGNKKFIELAGEAANGVIFPAGRLLVVDQVPADNKQKPVLEAYMKIFQEKYNYAPSTFGGHAWDAFEILIAAIKAAGDDPEKIRAAIETGTKDFTGITGTFNMSVEDHNGLQSDSLAIIEIKDGKWTLKDN
ncbi:ABC transporter substrate-binding protein [Aneurinibacillus thermoaerophilus]|uniref:ABC transporter substrate-binding protein n=1 Tax=Aneurinibacillus thermoaerophilus TaxID=143495 RepID=A0ABX8YEP8_ANETH|nr:ABC transporter substrate-binding protein [Aneurinibacillus thermoaerophilus]MED0737790.1 ABC transporter substrate-binding protein [Aneurinibacillus thermoaerophilus]MED0755778.1 ABC transporter substrate-binding protein [Aneurinibacillus thermoaerophilus]MED0759893.1 ABC transporter substrate-binding protein [Aneurinibacillus thermoaerophilus]QYY43569.1 ABC transporter substrate-binding protein [Aneurinibacillus thermoaerophilus]